jgi:hypothetical protein
MVILTQARSLYQRHRRWVPIVFFVLGFIFDTVMLRRVDELSTLIQQAVYLLASAGLIGIEISGMTHEIHPHRLLARVWVYREAALHFLLGTLLNSYTIFYFKSASTITSFVFIAILVVTLTLNEFKHFGKSQTSVHVAFWALCLISYCATLSPILFGQIGTLPFLVAMLASGFLTFGFYRALRSTLALAHETQPRFGLTQVLAPAVGIQLLFTTLYFAGLIPPVPLSVRYMGIYHGVEKGDGEYQLTYTRPFWKFWQHGDQTFLARPGDAIICFASIFSPTRFRDQLQIRWLFRDGRGNWQSADAIPLPVSGGREEGYRTVTRKTNYQPGDWRVQIETSDGREVGRIHFKVEADPDTGERTQKTEVR